jgi:hypothetical protein
MMVPLLRAGKIQPAAMGVEKRQRGPVVHSAARAMPRGPVIGKLMRPVQGSEIEP